MISEDAILNLIKSEMCVALGCTEPIAIVLAVAKAREILSVSEDKIDRLELSLSGNMYKNAGCVGIPGTKIKGINIAAALGLFCGDTSDKLQILAHLDEDKAKKAEKFVGSEKINVKIKEGVDKLYVKAEIFSGEDIACCEIEKEHTNITSCFLNSNQVFCCQERTKSYTCDKDGKIEGLSIEKLYDCAKNIELSKLDFILKGAEINWAISEQGLKNSYGLALGRILRQKSSSDKDSMRRIMARVSGGIDARMNGSEFPVMTNSGSGNQGITIYIPVIETALEQQSTTEELARALFFANSCPIYIKKQIGVLSALCGIIPACIGAACGVAMLKGASEAQIANIIKLIIANISGMFCDGAKSSCSMKAASGICAAFQAIYIVMDNEIDKFSDGIVDNCVEKSIENLSKMAVLGMKNVDEEILEIIKTCKR